MHQSLARADRDFFVSLVESLMLELDDALRRPRLALALGQHGRAHAHRIAMEQRMGEFDIRHTEIAHSGAERRVAYGNTDHQS